MSFHKNETVEKMLEKYPRARQDDKFLALAVWDNLGLKLTEEQMRLLLLKLAPGAPYRFGVGYSLREKGKYLPPKSVQDGRDDLDNQTRMEIVR